MQEIFYEETAKIQNEKSAKTKYLIFKVLSILMIAFSVIWAIFAFNFILSIDAFWFSLVISLIPLALLILSAVIFGKFKNRFYVDYDYTIVSGSVRFSKVIYNVKRKGVCSFDAKNIERIGKYESEIYKKYSVMPDIKMLVLSANYLPFQEKDFYYIYAVINSEKMLFVLECSKEFISVLLKFVNRTVIEEGLLK